MEQNRVSGLRERFKTLLQGGEYDYARPRPGDVIEAVIVTKSDYELIVDLGIKRDGLVPASDLSLVDEAYVESLEPGDTIPVVVMRRGLNQADIVRVSLNRGLQQQDWLRAQELLETGEIVEAPVVDTNRGGVLVDFGRIRGFVPNSHLGSLPSGVRRGRLQETKEELVGRTLPLVVIEVNRRRRRLVLSKRAVDRRRRAQLLKELEPGQVLTGVVRNLVDFGAFVDLGGIDGLVHISELDWQHVKHPRDVLSEGDEIQVYVLNVDPERQRIGLSRKRLLPDPWESVTGGLSIGHTVTGQVTNVVDFGLFVDIGQGVEGLVHESQVPSHYGPLISKALEGASVSVQILYIDEQKHQIGLRLVSVEEWSDTSEETAFARAERELETEAESEAQNASQTEGESDGVLLY